MPDQIPVVSDTGTAPAPLTPVADAPAPVAVPTAPDAPESPLSLGEAGDAWLHADPNEAPDPAGRARNPDGTFAAATPAEAPSPAEATDTPTPASDDPTAPEARYIEAQVDGETVKLRADTLIPVTRKGKTTYEPLEKVQREGMLKVDYDTGKSEQKARERELRTREALINARAEQVEAEAAQVRAAMTDEGAFQEYQEHLRLMQDSPRYKAAFEAKAERDQWAAEGEAQRTVERQAVLEDAVEQSLSWIDAAVARYPGVDPERVRQRYSEALQLPPESGRRARFHPDDINAIAADEHRYVTAAQSPLQAEMATMKATLDRQAAELAALKQNQTTRHALKRASTVPTGPAGGLPVAPGRRAVETPTGARDLGSMGDSWVRGG